MSDEFWDAVAPLLADGSLDEGTIMGGPCVRAKGEFVGEGQSFAPGGKVFREWVLIESHDEDRRRELVQESIGFVTG